MGWEIFESIEKYCKTKYGYGAHPDVLDTSRSPDDSMESFFLGETLKYLYLLMDPDSEVDLDEVSRINRLVASLHYNQWYGLYLYNTFVPVMVPIFAAVRV